MQHCRHRYPHPHPRRPHHRRRHCRLLVAVVVHEYLMPISAASQMQFEFEMVQSFRAYII